jgi:Glycosyltransferase family 87
MATSQPATLTLSSTLALCLALIGAASMLYYHQGLFMPRVLAVRAARGLGNGYGFGNDFYQVWLTSREWLRNGRDPYSPEMTREIQTGLFGRPLDPNRPGDPIDRRVFPYPAFTGLLFWPAAEFPFPPVRAVVVYLLAILTVACVMLWLRALDWRIGAKWIAVILLLTLSSYPALEGLYSGQLGLLVGFLLAAAMLAIQRSRFLLAGFLLALTTIKPQVTALVILNLLLWSLHLWRERGRMVIGFFSTLALLTAAALVVFPHWIQSWTHTVLAYRHYTQPPLVTEVLISPLGPHLAGPATLVLTAASIVIAFVLAWRNRAAAASSRPFWITLSLSLTITTITILQGLAIYDHLILLPAILLLVRSRNELANAGPVPRVLLTVGALLLFWPWISAFPLILLRPWLAPSIFNSTAISSLPIRTAASLPFAVLVLIAWMWRVSPRRSSKAV